MSTPNSTLVIDNRYLLINIETGQYPLSIYQVRTLHPNALLSSTPTLADLQFIGYTIVERVMPEPGQYATELPPVEQGDGTYRQVYEYRDYTPAERQVIFDNKKREYLVELDRLYDRAVKIGMEHQFDNGVIGHIHTGVEYQVLHQRQKERLVSEINAGPIHADELSSIRLIEDRSVSMRKGDIVALIDLVLDYSERMIQKKWDLSDAIQNATSIEELPVLNENLFP